jgi:hypothetical protein
MALTVGYIEVDELFFQVKQISVYRTLSVLCVLELWPSCMFVFCIFVALCV